MDGYGAGWSGPGAKTSGMNAAEQADYKAMKHRLEAEERAKRDAENEARVERGKRPLKDSVWIKVKRQLKRMIM